MDHPTAERIAAWVQDLTDAEKRAASEAALRRAGETAHPMLTEAIARWEPYVKDGKLQVKKLAMLIGADHPRVRELSEEIARVQVAIGIAKRLLE